MRQRELRVCDQSYFPFIGISVSVFLFNFYEINVGRKDPASIKLKLALTSQDLEV